MPPPRESLLVALLGLALLVALRLAQQSFPSSFATHADTRQQHHHQAIRTSSALFASVPHLRVTNMTSFFTLSLVEQHPAKFLFKYVCVDNATMEVLVFADSEEVAGLWTSPSRGGGGGNTMNSMFTKFRRKPIAEWDAWVKRLGGYVAESNVLYYNNGVETKSKVSNPAHCLEDVLFSLFVEGPAAFTTFDLYFHRLHPGSPCDVVRDWCCFMFHRQGVFHVDTPVTSDMGFCFENLWIPHFSVGRFAIDFEHLPPFQAQTKEYWYYEDPRHNYRLQSYLNQAPGSYPLASVNEMHRRALKGAFPPLPQHAAAASLVVDEWRKVRRAPSANGTSRPPNVLRRRSLLLITRAGERRRVWGNAGEFVEEFAMRFTAASGGATDVGMINLMGIEWGTLLPIDQARMFNLADIIISPHGAALSNLMFARRHAAVVELGCGIRSTLQDETFVLRHFSWFGTFAHRLGMKVLYFATPSTAVSDPAECSTFVKSFSVNASALFDYLVEEGVFDEIEVEE